MPVARSTRRVALAVLGLLASLALAACGSSAATTSASTSAPPAASSATAAASTGSATAGTAAPASAEGARATGTANATPQALATGSPRAGIAPQRTSPLAPRANRSGFVVALDPGHGGDESGAAAYGIVERDSNLDMAQRVGEYLKAAGVQVYLTREDNGRATGLVTGSGDNRNATRNDLQTRVSAANRMGADVFVSLHSNGGDPSLRGVEVYYESRRPFADENSRLAQNLLDGALRGLANAGHPSNNRGIIDAACWRNFNGRCVGLFVLSPGGETTGPNGQPGPSKEATNMPAALLETLFISSPEDAALLADPAVRSSVAKGIADGILRYLGVPA